MIKKTSLGNLKYKSIVDANGEEIGTIRNAVVNKSDLSIRGFVVHGTKMEEMLEALKMRPDVDPLITGEVIEDVMDNKIVLNKKKDELVNIMQPGELKEDEVLFNDFKRMPVIERASGRNIGLVKDIHFDINGKAGYSLGGQDFLDFLRSHRYTTTIDYVVEPFDIEIVPEGWMINADLALVEKNAKQNLTNIIRELLITAESDGDLDEDEKALIDKVRVDLSTYHEALEEALEDSVITKEELEELEGIKEMLVTNAVSLARTDQQITPEESALIKKLAGYMVDKRKNLFWQVFGTHKD